MYWPTLRLQLMASSRLLFHGDTNSKGPPSIQILYLFVHRAHLPSYRLTHLSVCLAVAEKKTRKCH